MNTIISMPLPLLSIAIPTHNRSQYAFYAIRSILSINDQRIELVVSDTSPGNELEEMLAGEQPSLLEDRRLKYLRPAEQLGMTGNHNHAISATTGEYICLIGDDDTITHDAVLAADWASQNGIEAIAPEICSNYAWPDFRSSYFGSGHAARLYVPKKLGTVTKKKGADAVATALTNATQGTEGLPKIYHGIVKRSLVEKIFERSNGYFHGSSPDVSGALALALVCDQFIVIDYPLTIPGASAGSNTGRSAVNKHIGKLEDEKQTRSFEKKGWSAGVPKFFSVETVWAHAALETLQRMAPKKIKLFKFSRLLAICKALHPEFHQETDLATQQAADILNEAPEILNREIGKEVTAFRRKRFFYILKRSMRPTAAGGRRYIGKINTIETARTELEKYMQEHNYNWNDFISNAVKNNNPNAAD